MQRRERFTRNQFKKLLKDAGVELTVKQLNPLVYRPIAMSSVKKVLALHHQRTGATEIRRQRRAAKKAERAHHLMSSSPKPPLSGGG